MFSLCILTLKPVGLTDRSHIGSERKTSISNITKEFVFSNWKDRVVNYRFGGEGQEQIWK